MGKQEVYLFIRDFWSLLCRLSPSPFFCCHKGNVWTGPRLLAYTGQPTHIHAGLSCSWLDISIWQALVLRQQNACRKDRKQHQQQQLNASVSWTAPFASTLQPAWARSVSDFCSHSSSSSGSSALSPACALYKTSYGAENVASSASILLVQSRWG